jgi:hypothetical protein
MKNYLFVISLLLVTSSLSAKYYHDWKLDYSGSADIEYLGTLSSDDWNSYETGTKKYFDQYLGNYEEEYRDTSAAEAGAALILLSELRMPTDAED